VAVDGDRQGLEAEELDAVFATSPGNSATAELYVSAMQGKPADDRRASTPIIGLDHAQVAAPVGSEGEARAFYGQLLGLLEIEKPVALRARGGVWFACGAQQLHVGVVEAARAGDRLVYTADPWGNRSRRRTRRAGCALVAGEKSSAAGSTVKWDFGRWS
jgi:hypothetical protein